MARKIVKPKPHAPMTRGFYNRFYPHYNAQVALDLLDLVDNGDVHTRFDIAKHFGTHIDVISDWARDHEDFRVAYRYAIDSFANRLARGLEQGAGVGSIFLLKVNHGFIEADKRWQLEMHEKELKAKLEGKLGDKGTSDISITFTSTEPTIEPTTTPIPPVEPDDGLMTLVEG